MSAQIPEVGPESDLQSLSETQKKVAALLDENKSHLTLSSLQSISTSIRSLADMAASDVADVNGESYISKHWEEVFL